MTAPRQRTASGGNALTAAQVRTVAGGNGLTAPPERTAAGSLILLLLLAACTGVPDGLTPVTGFQPERYLGTWYEIARLDHRFERGLTRVTAEYTRQSDGSIRVVNRGFDAADGEWKEAVGKALPNGEPDEGRLKVSFFGPFYGAYNIIALDRQDYAYAMVAGPSRDYLWILARTPALGEDVLRDLLAQARAQGFEVDDLIFVEHDTPQG